MRYQNPTICKASLLAAAAFITSLASQQASAALISHYTFDEISGTTAVDSMSIANGTIGSNVTLGTVGKFGTAFTFNNDSTQNGIVDMGNATGIFSPINVSQAVTISLWMKWTSSSDNRDCAVFLGNNLVDNAWIDVGTAGGSNPLGSVYGRVRPNGGATTIETLKDTGGGNDGQWHHIAYTANAATDQMGLYVDGVFIEANTTAFTFPTLNNFEIGRLGRLSATDAFAGSIDDLRIYNTVLTAGEISTLAVVPEPSAALLGGLGLLGLLRRRRN